jgi:iron complex transport system ATP-binding protein
LVNDAFFELRHATVWQGEVAALKNFSLTLRRGEGVAILGPNGAGKSTLLKVLTGELRPEADGRGFCELFGEELWSIEELRHRIGLVMPEEVSRFHPEESALDVVLSSLRGAYGRTREMRFSRRDRARAMEAVDQAGVAHLTRRLFGALSSGERRRFLIARALVHEPEVLVLDEPTTALDFSASIHLGSVLRELARNGQTLVWVTHHPAEIPPEIQRVVLLRDGEVLADGPKRKVLCAAQLSTLYQVPLGVRWHQGWCEVRPD